MFGLEYDYCKAMILALMEANNALLETSNRDAVTASHVPHKGDTLGLDQRPENAIVSELMKYDQYAVIITEERGEQVNPFAASSTEAVHGARTFFGCDPCDRSNQLRDFLSKYGQPSERVADTIFRKGTKTAWEKVYGTPAAITGANTALTCVRRGLPFGTALFNYITQELTLACSAGVYHTTVPRGKSTTINFDSMRRGEKLSYRQPQRPADYRRFVTFLGKPERGYPQNFAATQLIAAEDTKSHLHYDQPGGPTRILYLTGLQPATKPVGFIVANGEKIGEWIHWLPFIRYSQREDDRSEKALRIFEITQEKTDFRDGYMMAPSANYSIFRAAGSERVMIDVDRLRDLDNPSKYRGTLLVTPTTNKYIIGRAQQHGYRELSFVPPRD